MFWENKIICEDLKEIFGRDVKWEKLKNKTVLITGAYGMLASYLVFMCIYLNEICLYDMKLILAVRNEEKARKRFGNFIDKEYISLYLDDINKPIQIKQSVHYIIHSAGLASTQYYGSIPVDVILPNVLGTVQLLRLAEKKAVESFLLFSSGEIYGEIADSATEISETSYGAMDSMNLRNCYGEAKRMAEMLCLAWCQQKEVPTKVARIFHSYGPTMDIENDKRVFSSFVANIVNKQDIIMRSDGNAKRPFCYIADATAAFFQILLEGKNGNAYNVCNQKEYISIKELAEILVSLYPGRNFVQISKDILNEKRSEKLEAGKVFSDAKLKELGWECKYSVEQGFQRTVQSFQEDEIIK